MAEHAPTGNDQQSDDRITFAIKKSTLNAALVVAVSFASGFGVAWFIFGSPDAAPQDGDQTELQTPTNVELDVDGRPQVGPADAQVTVVEFTDYECPFCGRHNRETLPQLLSDYEGTINYVVLNFPITRLHRFAQQASEAAECAHDQGRFWDYHDTLFQNQSALGVDSLKQYAGDLGLDTAAFDLCLDSGAKTQLVLDDVAVGLSSGVAGTPSFFINGRLMVGARPIDTFRSMIDEALGQATSAMEPLDS